MSEVCSYTYPPLSITRYLYSWVNWSNVEWTKLTKVLTPQHRIQTWVLLVESLKLCPWAIVLVSLLPSVFPCPSPIPETIPRLRHHAIITSDCCSPSKWWKFAITAQLETIHDRNQRHSMKYLVARVHDINTYAEAFTEYLALDPRYIDDELKVHLPSIVKSPKTSGFTLPGIIGPLSHKAVMHLLKFILSWANDFT